MTDVLDELISNLDFVAIEQYLAGYYSTLANNSVQSGKDTTLRWRAAFGFLVDVHAID